MSETEQSKAELWAIVDIVGHDRAAGRYEDQGDLVRVDIPTSETEFLTRLIGKKSIYSVYFVDEAAARLVARQIQPQPISAFDLKREMARLMAPKPEPEPEEAYYPNQVDLLDDDDDDPDDDFENERSGGGGRAI